MGGQWDAMLNLQDRQSVHTMGRKRKAEPKEEGFAECRPIPKKEPIELEKDTILSKCVPEILPETPEEMIWFVRGQASVLRKTDEQAYCILLLAEGENQFKPILDLPEFADIKQKLYIGDLKGYFEWCQSSSSSPSTSLFA